MKFENYLDVLNEKNRCTFCRFRTSNHRLLIKVRRALDKITIDCGS